MENKDFIFFDPDCLDGYCPKSNQFYVGPISTPKKILVKIGPVVFPEFCLHTNTQTHRHIHTQGRKQYILVGCKNYFNVTYRGFHAERGYIRFT